MRNIDLSNISSTVGMPSKSGLLQHLQAAYQEAFAALIGFNVGEGITPGSRIFYSFVDCRYIITGSVYTISAGAISNNGAIYLVDSQSVTVASGQVVVGTITKSYLTAANADPTEFTDGTTHNVLEIYKIVFSSGISGSTDFDLSNLVYLNDTVNQATLAAGYSSTSFASTAVKPVSYTIEIIKGKVNIFGLCVANTTTSAPSIIFTLPVKYRPLEMVVSTVNTVNTPGTGSVTTNVVFIHTNGDVEIQQNVTAYTDYLIFNLTYFI